MTSFGRKTISERLLNCFKFILETIEFNADYRKRPALIHERNYRVFLHVMDFQVNLGPIKNFSYLSLITGIMFGKAEESFFFPQFARIFFRGPL